MALIADWQALRWLSAQLSHRYVGDRHYDGDLANQYMKLDHYRTTDLQLTAHYRGLYLRAGAYNLENHQVADYGNYNATANSATLYPCRTPLPYRGRVRTLRTASSSKLQATSFNMGKSG